MYLVSTIIFIISQPLLVRCIVFSVPHQLARLFMIEEELVSILRITTEYYKSDFVDLYLDTCKPRFNQLAPFNSSAKEKSNYLAKVLVDLVGNPVHVYSLVDRLVLQLPEVRKELGNQEKAIHLAKNIDTVLGDTEMPDESDLEGVTQALARIQFAYRLDPVELARGRIRGVETEARLSVRQMMKIAEKRFSGAQPLRPAIGKEYALAIEWTEAALTIAKQQHKDKHREESMIRFLHRARLEHNNNWHSPAGQRGNYPNEEFFVRRIESDPNPDTGKTLRIEEEYFLSKETRNGHLKQGYNIHDFYALCRGEKLQQSRTPSQPICRMTHKNDPYFFIAPLKEEIVAEDPPVRIYHGVLTDAEIDVMTTKILSQLEAATVQDVGVRSGGGKKVSNERTQSSGWIWDQEHPLLHKLSKKTGKIVQLETTRPDEEMAPGKQWKFVEAEAWQMGLYGPGGHYLPHYDAFDSNLLPPDVWGADRLWVGNRIATVMFYLSDLVGGSTAFPKLGIAATPSKGSAVFWYNLHKDGRRDDLSLHGACPTALGIKWVSNKWIREGAQIWKMPCS